MKMDDIVAAKAEENPSWSPPGGWLQYMSQSQSRQ